MSARDRSSKPKPAREPKLGRREFHRRLGGLAALSLSGCKIEPILDLPPSPVEIPLAFPDLPPQIPDQLEDAETTLDAITDELLDQLIPLLTSGGLRERPSERQTAVSHLLGLMRSFGLDPAANRGGWLQPVPLDIVEPTGAAPRVALRPESEAALDESSAPEQPDPEQPEPEQPEPEPEQPEPPASRIIELAELGAFRQRGAAMPHRGLLVGPIREFKTPLASESYVGRVALLRVPKGFELAATEAPARVDLMFSAVRDAGAVGCLLLTDADEPAVARFRQLWQRQVRRAGNLDEAMLIEGVLGAEGRAALEAAKLRDEPWVLDVALATREFAVESYNLLGRVTGRERPDEAVVLTCSWDTPDPAYAELDTLRLIATLAAFHQLAEWARRSTPPRYSLVLLLTADAGLAAGQSIHAAWSANNGAETRVLLALDRPTTRPLPAVALSGHFDAATAELVRGVVASDGRDLLLAEQLSMPSLAPYLRYPAPVLAVGAPDPEALEDREAAEAEAEAEASEGEGEAAPNRPGAGPGSGPDPRAGIHADVRLLRNLVLALASRR